jgi:hypothetical protein
MDEQSNSADKVERAQKRTGTMWPITLSAISIMYSQATSIDFAFAALPLSELVGQLSDPQRPRRRRQHIEEDLESLAGKAPKSPAARRDGAFLGVADHF